MRQAWNRVFAAMDEQGPARTSHSSTDDPEDQRNEAAAAATADTALDAAGLSLRAVALAQRLGASTVGELMHVPTRELWRARGLSRATRTELVQRTTDWRRRLTPVVPEEASTATGDDALPGLDTVTARLMPAPAKKGADPRALVRLVLGLPGDDGAPPVTPR